MSSSPVAADRSGPVRPARGDLALVAGLWALAAVVVDPRGDFPLIDDWAYGLPVRALVEEGTLRFSSWQSMTLVSQVAWGALFSWPAGFSFTALRVSTLVAALAAVLAQRALVRELGGERALGRLAALALLASPVFLVLSFGFMTDVPFLALSLASAACLVRGLRSGRGAPLWAGFGLAVAAVLLRQVGLALPIAFAAGAALAWGLGRRWLVGALLPLGAIAALLFGWERAIAAAGLEPGLYPVRNQALAAALGDLLHLRLGVLRNPLERGVQLVVYAGLFAAPVGVALGLRGLAALSPGRRRMALAAACAASALALAALAATDGLLPRFGNVLVDFGTGPRTLAGGAAERAPAALWIALTAFALLSACALLVFAARGLLRAFADERPAAALAAPVFLIALAVVYFAPLALAYGPAFDRYFLLPTALLVALAGAGAADLPPAPRAADRAAACALAILLAFSVAGSHDYLAWNRARYRCAAWLETSHVPVDQIDAGFEFGSWRATQAAFARGEQGGRVDRAEAPFAVVFTPGAGDTVLFELPTGAWLPWAPPRIVAVRRAEAERTLARAPRRRRGDP
jgi:hypothetical protein